MKRRLFHKKVYWTKDFDVLATKLFNTNYSQHLWEHLLFHKGKHDVSVRELDAIINDIINKKKNYYLYEIETEGYNNIVKAVIRTSYSTEKDICIVFAVSKYGGLIVKTAWINNKDDFHTTLDKDKYYKPKFKTKSA